MTDVSRIASAEAYARAKQVIPGGVNSPVRAFRAVGGQPIFIAKGAGSSIFDIDGNGYLDYVLSWGPLILGHAHPFVVEAIVTAATNGSSFGAPTIAETELAELIVEMVPGVEMVRLVSSGTEATMSALRLARAATSKPKIIKFAGCYHGHADQLLVRAGSGVVTLGLPDSPGVPFNATADVLVADYNDLASVQTHFDSYPGEIAGIIVEPVAGNMGVVMPEPGFLEGLREITRANDALLIFDEVLCGFRVGIGGAVVRYGIDPDLICFGKVIGGGMPLAAYAGKKAIMELIAPAGSVYQAGTLSGNPVAVAAGLATLRAIKEPGVFDAITASTVRLAQGLRDAAAAAGVSVQVHQEGTLGCLFFNDNRVTDYASALTSDTDRYKRWFNELIARGVYAAPSQFEAFFVSAAHTEADISRTIDGAYEAMRAVAS
jgi:glutamate-1-semialdehyde 2,1-aminomutase